MSSRPVIRCSMNATRFSDILLGLSSTMALTKLLVEVQIVIETFGDVSQFVIVFFVFLYFPEDEDKQQQLRNANEPKEEMVELSSWIQKRDDCEDDTQVNS